MKSWGELDSSSDLCKENYEISFGTVFDSADNNMSSLIYYGKPYFMIIASSFSGAVIFYDSKTGKILKTLNSHINLINKVIKFNDEIFLSCSADNIVCGFSVKTMNFEKQFMVSSTSVVNILKLSDDHFLTASYDSSILVISYSKNEIVRRLDDIKTSFNTIVELSQKHDKCFYIGENDLKQTVHLVNYKTKKKIFSFQEHPKQPVKGMCIFNETKSGNEILIVLLSEATNGDCKYYDKYKHIFWFYNTSVIPVRSKVVSFVYDGIIHSVGMFKNRYICTGDNREGYIHFYDLQELFYNSNSSKALIIKKRVQDGTIGIHDFCFKESEYRKNEVELFFCGYKSVKSVFLYGLDVMDKLSKKDEKERIDFLHVKIENYSFQNKEIEKKMFVKLVLDNICIENILRVLLRK